MSRKYPYENGCLDSKIYFGLYYKDSGLLRCQVEIQELRLLVVVKHLEKE